MTDRAKCPHGAKSTPEMCSQCHGVVCVTVRLIQIEHELDRLEIKRALARASEREKSLRRSTLVCDSARAKKKKKRPDPKVPE